jgi:peptidoglycan/LPS O-acetylase OafA/YrhL
MAAGQHLTIIKALLPHTIFKVIFEIGNLGVPIFFVLSGYVMALTANSNEFNAINSVKFIARRLARLVPPYYFAIIFALFFLFIKSKVLGVNLAFPSALALLQHALFLQDFFMLPHINDVFWTLCIEVQFYLMFALLVFFADRVELKYNIKNARSIIFFIIASLSILWPINLITSSLWQGGFIGFWYSFIAGTIACWGWQKKGFLLKFAVVYSVAIFFIGIFYQNNFAITSGLIASFLLLASQLNTMGTWLNWRWLQWIGITSYSLYLLHNPITGASFNLINKFLDPNNITNEIIGLLIALSCCFIGAYIAFLLIEKPSIKLSHRFRFAK